MTIKLTLIYAKYTDKFSYYDDWLDAFNGIEFKLNIIDIFEPKEFNKNNLKKIEFADLIILHHSVLADNLNYIKKYKKSLCQRKGKLFSFVGNELNLLVLGLKPKIDFLKSVEPDFIFTQLLQEAGDWIYEDCKKSKILSLPHALNPNIFKPQIINSKRRISIGTRSTYYGSYLGDNDRNRILNYFKIISQKKNFRLDLEGNINESRFNRVEWANFLNQCKSTITTEAGSFYVDKDDKTLNEIIKYLKLKKSKPLIHSRNLPNKNSRIRKLYNTLCPKFIQGSLNKFILKNYILENCLEDENENFYEIWEKFFKDKPRAPVYTKCISSRHFDAVGTKTLQITFPGRFNDILLPEHYISLNSDFSNIDEIFSTLDNEKIVREITESAYHHILSKHTYEHRINKIVNLL